MSSFRPRPVIECVVRMRTPDVLSARMVALTIPGVVAAAGIGLEDRVVRSGTETGGNAE